MNAKSKLMAAIKRFGNFRENIGGVHKDSDLRRRVRHEQARVSAAADLFFEARLLKINPRTYNPGTTTRAEAVKELEGLHDYLGGQALAMAIRALSDPSLAEAEAAGAALLIATETKSIKRDHVTPMFAALTAARDVL